jgi:hypothetical protein
MKYDRALNWRKSSYSNGDGGACVEVATLGNGCAVRDSKDRSGPLIYVPTTEWSAFTSAVRSGEFG